MESQLGVDAVPFPVEVAPLGAFGAVDLVIDWLNNRQDQFFFHCPPADSRTLIEGLENGIGGTPDEFWELLRQLRRNVRRHQPYIIAVMETPLRSSRSGHQLGAAYHVGEGMAVVSLSAWKAAARQPDKSQQKRSQNGILAYYLIRLTIRLLCPEVREHQRIGQAEPACVFHTRQSPADLLSDVWNLTLCTGCIEAISQRIDLTAFSALKKLLEGLRPQAFQLTRRVWIVSSSSEQGTKVAQELYSYLSKREVNGHQLEPQVLKAAFSLSMTVLESAAQEVKKHDYAVLVLTADELVEARPDSNGRPSDDAVFLLGFFMGTLRSHRTFMVHDADFTLTLPEYVQAIHTAKYRLRANGFSVVEAGLDIEKAIEQELRR